MNKFKLILFAMLISLTSLNAQWKTLNEGLRGSLRSIDFVNEDLGWMAGGEGAMLKTADGGLNWHRLPIAEDWYIEDIDFVTDSIGWAVGWRGDIGKSVNAKTLDGGLTWNVQQETEEFGFLSICAINDSVVYVVGDTKIFKTTDGGSSWDPIAPILVEKYLWTASFINELTGIAAGVFYDQGTEKGLILKTFNGGEDWEEVHFNDLTGISDLKFKNDSIYFLSADPSWTVQFLCLSTDTLRSYSSILQNSTPILTSRLTSDNIFFASVLDSTWNNCTLLKSEDGGNSWQTELVLANWSINQMYFHSSNFGYLIAGPGGWGWGESVTAIYKIIPQANWEMRLLSYPFYDLHFTDQANGYGVGGYDIFHGPTVGDIFTSSDSGITWNNQYSIEGIVNTCEYVNESAVYFLSSDWYTSIYKLNNVTPNFERVYQNNFDSLGFEFYGNDLAFLDEDVGWAAGHYFQNDSSGAAFLGTQDGGATWELSWKYPNQLDQYYTLKSLCLLDSSAGWAVGESGLTVKFMGGNEWQALPFSTDIPLTEVFFLDKDNGWIFGGFFDGELPQFSIFHTTDGGGSWSEYKDIDFQINDMFFDSPLHGWGTGANMDWKGVLLETMDGGATWSIVVDDLISPLTALEFRNNHGWASGYAGTILRTVDAGASWIETSTNNVYPESVKLNQNYPNPFNSETVIRWQLAVPGRVELIVYNILGQKLTTLISEKQTAGTHRANWYAQDFPSGVYFYRIQTERFSRTRKMLLIK